MAKKKKIVKKPVKKAAKKSAVKKTVKKIVKKAAPKKKSPVKAKPQAKTVVKKNAKPVAKTAAKPLVIQKQTPKNIDYTKAVTPLGERLVARAVEAATMTAGGLYIPDTVDTRERYVKATVLATGSGAKNKKGHIQPMDVKVGDIILFPAHTSVRIQFNSEELHIVNESDVLGTV